MPPPNRPDSRAAAEVAGRIALIDTADIGCGGSGAPVPRELAPVDSNATVTGRRWDGHVGGIGFAATYRPGKGWDVELDAC